MGRHEPFGNCGENGRAVGDDQDEDSNGIDGFEEGVSDLSEVMGEERSCARGRPRAAIPTLVDNE